MALITAAAGGGNWTVGGTWVGGIAPTAADDALLAATSGNVTIDAGAVCRSLDCNTYTGTLTHTSGVTLNIGDATAGAGNIALRLVSGMTYTLGSATTSKVTFKSTSATQQTVATGGKTLASIDFDGVGGSWILASDLTTGNTSTNVTNLLNGSLDFSTRTCTLGTFRSSNSNVRSLTLGSAIIATGTASACQWDLANTTNLTFNAGTSRVTTSNGNGLFAGGGLTYNEVILGSGAGGCTLSGSNFFATLTLTASSSGRWAVTAGTTQTVSGTLTFSGTSATSMGVICSTSSGTTYTFSAATTVISNITFMDLTGAGAAAWTGTNIGDMGGNTTLVPTPAVERFFVATSGGSFNTTASWSETDGGASGASIPLPQDTARFTENSITSGGRTITVNLAANPALDFSNVLNTPAVTIVLANAFTYVNGGMNLTGVGTFTTTQAPRFCGRGSHSIVMNGKSLTVANTMDAPGGVYTFVDDFLSTSTFTLSFGTITTQANFTCAVFSCSNSNVRAVNLGSSTLTVTGTGNVFSTNTGTNLTFNAGTSTLVIADTSSAAKSVTQGSQILYAVTVIGGGGGTTSFGSNFRVTNFNCNPTASTILQFANAGNAITVTGDWNVNGIAGTLLVITSTSAGNQFTFTKASGLVTSRYVSIKDSVATGGASFQAVNSTDAGNNTGWVFSTASAGGGLRAGKKFAAFGGARPINKVLDSKLHGYRKLGG